MSVAAGAGGRRGEATWAPGSDGVVAAFHTKSGRIILVTSGFVEARDGRVVAHRAEPVRPTIIHLATFDAAMARGRWCVGCGDRCDSGRGNGRHGGWDRWGADGVVGAMEPRITGGETANAFLVAEDELGLEQCESPFREGADAKLLGCRG